jgi:competence protein ComEC
MAVSVFYMLLIGSPIPAQRAVIMTCVIMTAIMIDRNPFTLRLAVFAALLLFILSPESLMGPSFQMSFAAVVALIAFYESTAEWWKKHFRDSDCSKRYALYLLGCFATSLVASMATAPFALYHFGRMPLIGGLAANMVAVPVSSFVTFPVGLFSCLLIPFGLEKYPLLLTEKSLDVFMYVAEIIAAWEYAGWQANSFAGWVLGVMTLGGIWVCAWRGRLRWLGLVPVVIAAVLAVLTPRADMLVAGSGDLMALRAPDGKIWFSTLTKEKFVREQWTAREAQGFDIKVWPQRQLPGGEGDFLACDDVACRIALKNTIISVIRSPEAIGQECGEADVLISKGVVKLPRSCKRKADIIDRWKLRDNGAYAIYLQNGAPPRVVSVKDKRGERPWTGGEKRKKESGSQR